MDFNNPEHINMNHAAVQSFLIDRKVYPVNDMIWIKRDNMIGPKKTKEKELEHEHN